MSAARTFIEQALQQAAQRLSELDAVPVAQRPAVSYSDQGRSVSWAEYRDSLMRQITQGKEALASMQALGGPFQIEEAGPGYW